MIKTLKHSVLQPFFRKKVWSLLSSFCKTNALPANKYRLVAGLGNPGEKYRLTRHNIGFKVVDKLSEAYSIPLNRRKFDAVYGYGKIDDVDVVLVKPMAYMNRSGLPLRKLAKYFNISCEDIVVVHDDLDLAWERLKIKVRGGHGGHNGIRSIMEAFGEGGFVRVRIGIGRPLAGTNVSDYVLENFSAADQGALDRVINRTSEAVVAILCDGPQVAMNTFN